MVTASLALEEEVIGRWLPPFTVGDLDAEWDKMPSSPGVYIVRCRRAIPRAGGVDCLGTLYIGKAKNLRDRLWSVWEAQHESTGMLWQYPRAAAKLLRTPFTALTQQNRAIQRLLLRVATPLRRGDLNRAERALLAVYLDTFGEFPPLNSMFPVGGPGCGAKASSAGHFAVFQADRRRRARRGLASALVRYNLAGRSPS
jgi:hypothetical protein